MTYRQAFDHLGCLHSIRANRRRQQRAELVRWMVAVVVIIAWALLTGWMDAPR